MTDFIIIVLAVFFVLIFLRRVVREFKVSENGLCSGNCGGCRLKSGCKNLKK